MIYLDLKIYRKYIFTYGGGRNGSGGGILGPICPTDMDLLISGTF